MHKKPLQTTIVLLALLTCAVGNAQQAPPGDRIYTLKSIQQGNTVTRTFDNRYQGVKGGITLLENFTPGVIRISNGQLVIHDKVNYDALNDELVVFQDGKELGVNKVMVSHFVLVVKNDSLHFDRLYGPDNKIGFFQRVGNGNNIVLYKKVYKKLIEPDYRGAYAQGREYSELVTEHKYLFSDDGKKRVKEVKNKKSFSDDFPDSKELIDTFIKKKRIDFKTEEDLKQLFEYLNEIKDN